MKYFLLLTCFTSTVTSDLSCVSNFDTFSKTVWVNASGVNPAAWSSPKSCIVIFPSGRTVTWLLKLGLFQTRIHKTSSGPITKLLGSTVATPGVLAAAPGTAEAPPFLDLLDCAERSDSSKAHRITVTRARRRRLIGSIVQQLALSIHRPHGAAQRITWYCRN